MKHLRFDGGAVNDNSSYLHAHLTTQQAANAAAHFGIRNGGITTPPEMFLTGKEKHFLKINLRYLKLFMLRVSIFSLRVVYSALSIETKMNRLLQSRLGFFRHFAIFPEN